jgi:hypothetical protein
LFREGTPCFAAFHPVKHIDMLAADNVIQDFEQISICVKADKQMLVILSSYSVVKDMMRKSISASVTPCLKAA